MISLEEIKSALTESAKVKLSISKDFTLDDKEKAAASQIQKTISSGGVIRIISDRKSRWSAHHLNEELVVRFKAGSAFGRPDREALNSRQYGEYELTDVLGLLSANRFEAGKDTLVVFTSVGNQPELEKILEVAKSKAFTTIVIAPQTQAKLLELAHYSFSFPSADEGLIQALQAVALHAFCEHLEAEYDPNKHSFVEALKLSSEVDLKITGDSSLLSIISAANSEILKRVSSGGTLFLAGNGGSTCEANALAEYAKSITDSNGNKFEVLDLHAPDTLLCAYNDDHAPFARQIEANGRSGDVLLVYSTSGNSQNIVDAVSKAHSLGIATVGLLGKDGGKLATLCNKAIIVPAQETARIQETHALLGRLLLKF